MNPERKVKLCLFEMQDQKYRDFQSALIPSVERERIIGVRTPQLRAFAKQFGKMPQAQEFMKELPHDYYEENNLHACLIEQMRDFDSVIAALDEFLPYIDNWATCDMLRPNVFKAHRDELLEHIKRWLCAEHPYTVRFGLEMLMVFYLDECFRNEYLELAAGVRREEYYVRMMVAWFFATSLAKQYESTLPYLQQRRLEVWTHNKTIQKALESFRITESQKNELRGLKVVRCTNTIQR